MAVRRLAALMALMALTLPVSGCALLDNGDDGDEATPVRDGRVVTVTRITDGDTFRAGEERIRLIGVDTPEISGGVECFGREASAALERLIPVGTEVELVEDVEPEDRYDRTLAYVYRTSDDLHVNLRMAEDGYASPLTIAPNVAHADEFVRAAAEARDAGRGLWSACPDADARELDPADGAGSPDASGDPSDPSDPPVGGGGSSPDRPGTTVAGQEGCDPSYPGICIPPAPPDLDCADIPDRRFTVLAPDPHHFDGGGDGIGCESG